MQPPVDNQSQRCELLQKQLDDEKKITMSLLSKKNTIEQGFEQAKNEAVILKSELEIKSV